MSRGTTFMSKTPNQLPTVNGVERTIPSTGFTPEFTTLNEDPLHSTIRWSPHVVCSLIKLWVTPISTKATTFSPLTVSSTQWRPCLSPFCNICSRRPFVNLLKPLVKAFTNISASTPFSAWPPTKTIGYSFKVYCAWAVAKVSNFAFKGHMMAE